MPEQRICPFKHEAWIKSGRGYLSDMDLNRDENFMKRFRCIGEDCMAWQKVAINDSNNCRRMN